MSGQLGTNANRIPEQDLRVWESEWKGGFREGDPLDPMGPNCSLEFGYIGTLYATYLVCIRPYVKSNTIVLEIGPGGGAWTKCLLGAREVWCMDALSAEFNGFWEFLNNPTNVKYHQVSDFSCSVLPDDHFDFLFSYGCFCHISRIGFKEYMTNLFPKMKTQAHAFVMISDAEKYGNALNNVERLGIERAFSQSRPFRMLTKFLCRLQPMTRRGLKLLQKDMHVPGGWYNIGTEWARDVLESLGYVVVDADVGTNVKDPIIHFMKK